MDYQKHYNLLIDRARSRILEGYVERHHVLPKCMGGSDDKGNLVQLTPEEHFVAHVLLVKLHPTEKNLILAVHKMTRGHEGRRKKRKLYGWLRRKHAARMRELSSGSGNSQYGTRWVNDGTKSFKLKKEEHLPLDCFEGKLREMYYCSCGAAVSAYGNSCLKCRGLMQQKIKDSDIVAAIEEFPCGKIVDIATKLGCKNPNNIGDLRKRIIKIRERVGSVNTLGS